MDAIKKMISDIDNLNESINRLNYAINLPNITVIDITLINSGKRVDIRFDDSMTKLVIAVLETRRSQLIEEIAPLQRKVEIFNEILGIGRHD